MPIFTFGQLRLNDWSLLYFLGTRECLEISDLWKKHPLHPWSSDRKQHPMSRLGLDRVGARKEGTGRTHLLALPSEAQNSHSWIFTYYSLKRKRMK